MGRAVTVEEGEAVGICALSASILVPLFKFEHLGLTLLKCTSQPNQTDLVLSGGLLGSGRKDGIFEEQQMFLAAKITVTKRSKLLP